MTTLALILVLTSAALHAAWNAATKGDRNPTAFLFAFELLAVALLSPVAFLFDWRDLSREFLSLALVSALVHALYAYFLSRAYESGDLTLVYSISRATPAFVPLIAVPLLGDRLTPAGIAGILLVFVSLWLIQTSGTIQWRQLLEPGVGWAYLTLGATVGYSLFDKRAMDLLSAGSWHGPAPRALVYFGLLQALHLPLFGVMARRRIADGALKRLFTQRRRTILAAAIGSTVSYVLILQALRIAPVSYVVAVRQSSVVFAVVIALVWLRERPTTPRLVGILGTVSGIALIALWG